MPKSFSGPPPAFQDLSTYYDWLVKRAIVDFPSRMKGNSKCLSGNSLSPLRLSTRILASVADVTNRGKVPSATKAEATAMAGNMGVACEGGYLTSVFTLTSVSQSPTQCGLSCRTAKCGTACEQALWGVDTRENYFSPSPLGPPDILVAG